MLPREGGPTLFVNAQVFDGSGRPLFPGEVLVRGDRIAAVAEGSGTPEPGRSIGHRLCRRYPNARPCRGACAPLVAVIGRSHLRLVHAPARGTHPRNGPQRAGHA